VNQRRIKTSVSQSAHEHIITSAHCFHSQIPKFSNSQIVFTNILDLNLFKTTYAGFMILVTGGTGFIGSYFREHDTIRALKRTESGTQDTRFIFRHLADQDSQPNNETWEQAYNRIEWVEGDILETESLLEAMNGIDTVYHAAGMVSFSRKKQNKVIRTNVEGTANVVNACIETGVRKLAYLSSVAALARKAGETVNENAKPEELKFTNAYSESKYRAEMEAWRGMGEGLEVVIVNPGIVLGWGDFTDGSPEMFNTVYKGLKFYPTGSNAFVDARDVAQILILLVNNEKANNNRFILAGENMQYKALFDLMAAHFKVPAPGIKVSSSLVKGVWLLAEIQALLTGSDPFITRDMAVTSGQDYGYDSSKVLKLLGYDFMDIEKTVSDTCGVYLDNC
jgi:dihydroflavonol-4-reductase